MSASVFPGASIAKALSVYAQTLGESLLAGPPQKQGLSTWALRAPNTGKLWTPREGHAGWDAPGGHCEILQKFLSLIPIFSILHWDIQISLTSFTNMCRFSQDLSNISS